MNLPRLLRIFATSLAILTPSSAFAQGGNLNTGWNLNIQPAGSIVYASAVQNDGKVIIAGNFNSVLGTARNNIARIHANGSLDTTFNPSPNGTVHAVAVQFDGRIVFGGSFSSVMGTSSATRNNLARYFADGTLDTGFTIGTNGTVRSLAIDPSRNILVGGSFTTVGTTARGSIARIFSSGSLDTGFNPNPNGTVLAMALQADGKILLGGTFTTLQPNGAASATVRNRIARVNSTGTLDTTFDPNANDYVHAIVVQADGKVLLGGPFTTLQPNGAASATTRNRIARFNADATLDTAFNPNADESVNAIALQADGRIIIGGRFLTVASSTRKSIARLESTGALDVNFDPEVTGEIYSLGQLANGNILLGGPFTQVPSGSTSGGIAWGTSAMMLNDAITSSLTVDNIAQATWTRGGAAPEVSNVVFEYSVSSGVWQPVSGTVSRIGTTANWQITGASLPATATLRALGRITHGGGSASTGVVEAQRAYSGLAVPTIQISGNNFTIINGQFNSYSYDRTDFGSVFTASTATVVHTFRIDNLGSGPLVLGTPQVRNTSGTTASPTFSVTSQPQSVVQPGQFTTFQITFAPDGDEIGNFTGVFSITNNDPASGGTQSFYVRGTGRNTVPVVATPIPDQSAIQGLAFSYTVPVDTFSDADVFTGNTITYSSSGRPAWLSFNATTRTFSGTPPSGQLGSTNVTVTCMDVWGGSVSDVFALTVIAPNSPPTVANQIPDQSATQGVTFSYIIPENTFADADVGNVLSYSATGLPAWLSFDPSTRSFSGTPNNSHVGFADITVTATDNGTPTTGSVNDVFRLTVLNVNDAPTLANAIPDQSATEDVAFSYTLPINTFADIDAGNVFTYSTSTLPGWLSFNPSTRTFSGTPGDANVGSVNLTVTATDNGTPTPAAAIDVFALTVSGVNDVPVFTKGADQTHPADTNTLQTITGWATNIQDGDSHAVQALTFLITANDNPGLFTVAPAVSGNGTLTYTPNGTSGTATIGIALRDDATAGGAALTTLAQTFTITIEAPVLTDLERWREQYFESTDNTGDAADGFDFDKDGVPNLVEFAFGMNPKAPDAALLPKPVLDNGSLSFSYQVPAGVAGITHGAQWSTSLDDGDWHAVPNTGTAQAPVFSVSTAGRPALFLRHSITPP